MQFSRVAEVYESIEATTKRLEMTDLLADLLKHASKKIIDKIVYLTQGRLGPTFSSVEMGIAEKLAIQLVARTTGKDNTEIQMSLTKTGDIGETAELLLAKKTQSTLFKTLPLTVLDVYDTLDKMAHTSGTGSMERKMGLLSGLLARATPKEGKYLIRIVTGNLRLGIADMTMLDSMAIAYGGGKDARNALERAYNISSDLGKVARILVDEGLEGVSKFRVSLGNPIRPMMAERLSTPEEILKKLGGRCMAEFKYDGERVQAHKNGNQVTLFSRRLERITEQYPDAVELLRKHLRAEKAIVEAECVAVNSKTGELRPFQELMHRRRKYGVKEAMAEHPVSLFVFDVLYADGEDYTLEPYSKRHSLLEGIVLEGERIKTAESLLVENVEDLKRFFKRAVEDGCEGIMCKSVNDDSVYQAGARGWLWIKFKRDYQSEMIDTVDLAVVGAFHGRGKRAGVYGAFLLAAYNQKTDSFETVTKCGTGFTDEDLAKMKEMVDKHKIPHRHPRVESMIHADVWFEPSIVIEVLGAEITLSPVHATAMNSIRKGSGLAIRFPRFTGKYRPERSAEDSTTTTEVLGMYQNQLRKLKGSTQDKPTRS